MSAVPSSIAAASQRGAVLLRQRDELTIGPGARGPARVGEEHECQEPGGLTRVREALVKATHQAQGLPGELRALQVRAGGRDVALVEHQVQHMLDRCQPRPLLGPGGS